MDDMMDDDVYVGAEIRSIRRSRHLSTAALAAASGVSAGMINQIERGVSSPSLRILSRLAEALRVPLTLLIEEAARARHDPGRAKADQDSRQTAEIVRRSNKRPCFLGDNSSFYKEIMSPHGAGKLQMTMMILPPGSAVDGMIIKTGEKAGFVTDGTVVLEVDGVRHQIANGDSFQFDAMRPHQLLNESSDIAKVFWVTAFEAPALD